MKGGVHSGSMNILYLLQMPRNSLNTPTGDGMFVPSIHNLANRRLQSICIGSLRNLFRGSMALQWRVWGHHGVSVRIEGEVRSTVGSSQQKMNP